MQKTPLYHINKKPQIPLCVEKQKYEKVGTSFRQHHSAQQGLRPLQITALLKFIKISKQKNRALRF